MGDRADRIARAGPVLRSWRVAVDLRVGVKTVLVVIEPGVLHDDGTTGVCAGVPQCRVFHPGLVDGDAADLQAGSDVHPRIVHVRAVDVGPGGRACCVAGEDPILRCGVLAVVEGRSGREVGALVACQSDGLGAEVAIPPDLVATIASAIEKVAHREVVDAHVVGLGHDDAISTDRLAVLHHTELLIGSPRRASRSAGLGAVDDGGGAIHASDVDARRRDQDSSELAVVA